MKSSSIINFKLGQRLVSGLEVHQLSDLYATVGEVITSFHRTDFYTIIWFQKGNTKHIVDFIEVETPANTVLFLNEDTIQRFDTRKDQEGKVIVFHKSFFDRTEKDAAYLENNVLFHNLFPYSIIQLGDQEKAFSSFVAMMDQELGGESHVLRADILRHLLYGLLLVSERNKITTDGFEPVLNSSLVYVKTFRSLLEKGFRVQKNVVFYAGQMLLTEKRLGLATIEILGITPKQFILERILLEAKRQLLYSNLSIKEIASDLGYDEATNFVKFFKNHSQLTPKEFRMLHIRS
ncbi:helix-turn-helix domain-containing protein [Pedobacter sp. L105]|uniref:helix-turn-helix domain-containing protein n=1 Tax=Pedobacter sp. L105 TaxID=1641871 RepID=UPI00131CB06A|nr:helix-turn-helix domain-containing protein [Pedobacter sp. L105]